jgi:hypothetical protein
LESGDFESGVARCLRVYFSEPAEGAGLGAGLGGGFFAGVEIPMLIRKNLSPLRRDARMLMDSILSFHPFTVRFIDLDVQTLAGAWLAFPASRNTL